MPSTVRRSDVLEKKLQRRNNSLKPADFRKEQIDESHAETKKDPVEKSKAALSDLRKRIDERKRLSNLIDVKQYQEGREEKNVPELAGATFTQSKLSERQEPSSPVQKETLAERVKKSKQLQRQIPVRDNVVTKKDPPAHSKKNPHKDQDQGKLETIGKDPPSHIEVRSKNASGIDDHTEVSEITTDVRIGGNNQPKLPKPLLSNSTGNRLERDVNIKLSNLRHLGEAVEQAKLDLQKELSPKNDAQRRHGLPYEATDYHPSVDEDEGDSWGDAIRTNVKGQTNKIDSPTQSGQFIADKTAARKINALVTEAFSYEGDVFIDATNIREEDLDGEEVVEIDRGADPKKIDVAPDDEMASSCMEEHKVSTREELVQQSIVEEVCYNDKQESNVDHDSENLKENDTEDDTEDAENEPSSFTKNFASMASDFHNSSLGFLKSFNNQVETQLKTFEERGLISKSNMEGMMGVLKFDVKETKAELPKDGDDAAINLGDEFEKSVCSTKDECNNDSVEKMLETLKKSYNTGISKCGIDSDLIKENTKAIEEMVAKLKNVNHKPSSENDKSDPSSLSDVGNAEAMPKSPPKPESPTQREIDGSLLKELAAQGVEDICKKPIS